MLARFLLAKQLETSSYFLECYFFTGTVTPEEQASERIYYFIVSVDGFTFIFRDPTLSWKSKVSVRAALFFITFMLNVQMIKKTWKGKWNLNYRVLIDSFYLIMAEKKWWKFF